MAIAADRVQQIADTTIQRLQDLDLDGLILYDIDDEAERNPAQRPFPFTPTLDPADFLADNLAEWQTPVIVYRAVAKHDRDNLRSWLAVQDPSRVLTPKIGNRLINARVETLAGKLSWRGPFRRQRAVIPAAGYFEWAPRQRDATVRKQPYYLHPTDPNGVLSFAGLYELWRDPSKDKSDPTRWLWTAVIITTDATGPAGDIHDRTPLILPPDRVNAWLDPTRTEPDQI